MKCSASFDITIHASPDQLWTALTDPAWVKRYFFDTNLVTDWNVGSPLFFRGEWEGKPYEDRGTVLSFDPKRSLSFNYWSAFTGHPDTPDTRTIVRYDLTPQRDSVLLTVTQSGFDTQARADDSTRHWQEVLNGLKRLLES